jgi:hypothetical protein
MRSPSHMNDPRNDGDEAGNRRNSGLWKLARLSTTAPQEQNWVHDRDEDYSFAYEAKRLTLAAVQGELNTNQEARSMGKLSRRSVLKYCAQRLQN